MAGIAYITGKTIVGGEEKDMFAAGTVLSDGYVYFNDIKDYRCTTSGKKLQVLNTRRKWVLSDNISNINVSMYDISGAIGGNGSVSPYANLEAAVQWCIDTANDPSHGYDQQYRTGPDYDCASFICAGLRAAGFTGVQYWAVSGMVNNLPNLGFTYRTDLGNDQSKLVRGDILIAIGHHTEMYIGGGQNVGAHINEKGTITGGKTGDQTGHEISVGNYYKYPWSGVLRYNGQCIDAYLRMLHGFYSMDDGYYLEEIMLTAYCIGIITVFGIGILLTGIGCAMEGATYIIEYRQHKKALDTKKEEQYNDNVSIM